MKEIDGECFEPTFTLCKCISRILYQVGQISNSELTPLIYWESQQEFSVKEVVKDFTFYSIIHIIYLAVASHLEL